MKPAAKRGRKAKLTDKQKKFCLEYVIDMNASAAAVRAGYKEKQSNSMGYELLGKPLVAAEVKRLQNGIAKKLNITAEMVLAELAKIGFSNIQDYIKAGYEIDEIPDIDKNKAGAIAELAVTTNQKEKSTTVKFRLHDKISALEKIAKHIGFFEKDNKQQGAADSTIKVEIVRPSKDDE